jgi:hypothetical protein
VAKRYQQELKKISESYLERRGAQKLRSKMALAQAKKELMEEREANQALREQVRKVLEGKREQRDIINETTKF